MEGREVKEEKKDSMNKGRQVGSPGREGVSLHTNSINSYLKNHLQDTTNCVIRDATIDVYSLHKFEVYAYILTHSIER